MNKFHSTKIMNENKYAKMILNSKRKNVWSCGLPARIKSASADVDVHASMQRAYPGGPPHRSHLGCQANGSARRRLHHRPVNSLPPTTTAADNIFPAASAPGRDQRSPCWKLHLTSQPPASV